MENIWQFSKVYKRVYKSSQYYSRFNKMVIWNQEDEIHVDGEGNITDEYHQWRNRGFSNKYAVRYPNGFNHKSEVLYSLWNDIKLDYVEARKEIYVKVYEDLALKTTEFYELVEKLRRGENLLIVDVDGPHQESLNHYMETYGVNKTFIEKDSVLVTDESIDILLNDTKHSYGHGYVLANLLRSHI